MFPLMSRRRLVVAGGLAAFTAAAAGGGVLASRATAASVPTASNAPATAQASPTPGTKAPGSHRGRHHGLVLGRVTAVSSSSITLADPAGTTTTYAVSPNVRVTTWNRSQESLTSIPTGEIVVLAEGRHRAAGQQGSTSSGGTTTPMVVLIRDMGFKAA